MKTKRIRVISDKRCEANRYRCPGSIDNRGGDVWCIHTAMFMQYVSSCMLDTTPAGKPIRPKACLATGFDAYIEIPEEAGR